MTEAMFYVLLALLKPCHGYQIMQSIKELSHDRLSMGPGTLYGILNRLEKKKLIKLVEQDNRKKIYLITDFGKETLIFEYNRLLEMVKDGEVIERECL
jgi:DNA-binding PadR family transcriptional regulator